MLLLLDLQDDALQEIVRAFGEHAMGLMSRVRLRFVCKHFNGLQTLALRGEHVQIRVEYLRRAAKDKPTMPTYDIHTGSVCLISNAPDLFKFKDDIDCKLTNFSARIYVLENRLLWTVDKMRLVGFENYDANTTPNRKMSCKFRIPPDALAQISDYETREHIVTKKRRQSTKIWFTASDIEKLLNDLFANIQSSVQSLQFCGAQAPEAHCAVVTHVSIKPIVPSRLQHLRCLSLTNTWLSPSSMCEITKLTHLRVLDLSGSLQSRSFAIELLLIDFLKSWFAQNNYDCCLCVDDCPVLSNRWILTAMSNMISSSSMFESQVGMCFCDKVHLSMHKVVPNSMVWYDVLRMAEQEYGNHLDLFNVRTRVSSTPAVTVVTVPVVTVPAVTAPAVTAPAVTAPAVTAPAVTAPVALTSYTQPGREQGRYMWQWFDYTCKSCGLTWVKNSVTISFRQTAVSECLRKKRACNARPECIEMLSGSLFITKQHCVDIGGTRLTPTPDEVLTAEKSGLLVGIIPNGNREFFKPHPNRIGLKVPVHDV